MLAAWSPRREGSAAKVFERALAQRAPKLSARAHAVLDAVESCRSQGLGGLLIPG
jgi:hypothetical protein